MKTPKISFFWPGKQVPKWLFSITISGEMKAIDPRDIFVKHRSFGITFLNRKDEFVCLYKGRYFVHMDAGAADDEINGSKGVDVEMKGLKNGILSTNSFFSFIKIIAGK